VAIRLTTDRKEINADGEDVAILKVEVLDKGGRAIPTAGNKISFKVSGEGALIGVGNGDPNCQESDKEPKRSLFNGLAQVIVQGTRTPGTITVEAYCEPYPRPVLPAVRVTIATKKVGLRASVE
jgi:beta-galactosidase